MHSDPLGVDLEAVNFWLSDAEYPATWDAD